MKGKTRGEATARVLFMSFIYVADCTKRIDPNDIEQLIRVMSDTSWTRHPYLLAGLESLRDQYEALWAEYEGGRLQVTLEAVRLRMAVAMLDMSLRQARDFKDALLEYLKRAAPISGSAFQMLGRASSAEKRQARKEIDDLLDAVVKDPRSKAPASASAAATATAVLPDPVATSSPPSVSVATPAAATPGSAWPVEGPGWEGATPWTSGKVKAVCVRVNEETHDVKTYTFAAVPARTFNYRPGQFVTLDVTIDGTARKRSYTISSSPSRPNTLSITVKRVPGGLMSNWLYENMRPGVELQLSGPHGHFTCFNHPAPKLLLISGGSGVTPMMSMLRWFADTAVTTDIVFLNNVRTPADIIFEQELAYLSTRMGSQLKLAIIPGGAAPCRPWNGPMGHLQPALLQALVPDFLERETFVCGPPPYMQIVQSMLEGLKYPMQRFHQESFGGPPAAAVKPQPAPALAQTVAMAPVAPAVSAPAIAAPPPAAPPVQMPAASAVSVGSSVGSVKTAKGYEVVLKTSGRAFDCLPDETVLDAAERNGIQMENSCRSGRCGACKVKKMSGNARMDGQEALSESDIESGYVLACVAQPSERLVLEA